MTDVKLRIQEINKLIQADPQSETLGGKLFLLGHALHDPDYANSFFQQDGLSCIFPLLKSEHDTIRRSTLKCFLALMCHYPVISAVLNDESLKEDVDIFCSLLSGFHRCKRFGEANLISSSMNALSILIQMLPNGIHLFRQAVVKVSTEEFDPYEDLVKHIVDRQLYKEALRLLQLIIRNSILADATGPVDRLVSCGVVKNLKSLQASKVETIRLTESEKILVDKVLLPLGDSCSRVGWYMETIKNQPTKKLEAYMNSINDNIEQEFNRMIILNKNLTALKSLSSRFSCESNATTTTTSTVQAITEKGSVSNMNLYQDEKYPHTPEFFFQTLMEHIKSFLGALKSGGGAPIKLKEIAQCIELPGKQHKQNGVSRMSSKKREQQIYFLIDVVSEQTSQILTTRHSSALSKVSRSDGQKLAECALWKIMDGLREDYTTQTCNAILKCITKKPQDAAQKFLSYVCKRSLPVSFHVVMYDNIAVDKFFAERYFAEGNESGQEEKSFNNSDISSPLAKKSDQFAQKINNTASQLHQAQLLLGRLEAEVIKLRSVFK